MKTIVVATDFSERAANALRYAVNLTTKMNASIIILHVYKIPVLISDYPVAPVTIDDLEEESIQLLSKIKAELMSPKPGLKIEILVRSGIAYEEIENVSREFEADLIVLGIKGHSRILEFFGSTATSVALHSLVPVLIVPEEAVFKGLSTLVFAFDYKATKATEELGLVKELSEVFKAEIHVINILNRPTEPVLEKIPSGTKLNDMLEPLDPVISFQMNEDTIQGILEYTERNNAELIVMLRRKHSFFEKLVHASYSRKMAFHTRIPLLVLHAEADRSL